MKNIEFHSELNAQQFSNRVNGVTNCKNDRFQVEFNQHKKFYSIDEKITKKITKEIYAYKCYNHCYDLVQMYGEYSSFEQAENEIANVLLHLDKNIIYLEICKMYKLK